MSARPTKFTNVGIDGDLTVGGTVSAGGVITSTATDGQIQVGQTGAAMAPQTISGDITLSAAGVAAIGAKKVTAAKTNLFYAAAQTGNAGAQVIAHGLGADPAVVLVIPTDGGTATYTHDATNVTVTCTNAKKYDVLAIA